MNGLVYPLPHADRAPDSACIWRKTTWGSVTAGADDPLSGSKDDYEGGRLPLEAFVEPARQLLPWITLADLQPGGTGIRAKLHGPDEKFADFLIERDTVNSRVIQVAGIDSPGLTSCLAIGQRVADLWSDARVSAPALVKRLRTSNTTHDATASAASVTSVSRDARSLGPIKPQSPLNRPRGMRPPDAERSAQQLPRAGAAPPHHRQRRRHQHEQHDAEQQARIAQRQITGTGAPHELQIDQHREDDRRRPKREQDPHEAHRARRRAIRERSLASKRGALMG